MHEAAYLLAFFTLLSQILGLVRDRLLAGQFGVGATLDTYYAAFRIPDFLFVTIASLFSLYALLPALARAQENSARIIESILVWFFVLTGIGAGVAYLLAPYLMSYIAPGFSPHAQAEAVAIARILLLQPILLGASNVLASLTQFRSRFVLYAISPLLYNLGIIFGITLLYPLFGLAGLAWGVVIGALMHALVQVPHFFTERFKESGPRVRPPLRDILMLSVPRTIALAAGQITILALVALASGLSQGSISAFTFSMNLQAVPLAVIGMSYSVAAFPTLSRFMGKGQSELFVTHMMVALRHIVFWSTPAIILIVVLRAQMVRVILGSGAFDWDATRLTAAALAILVVSLMAQSITFLLARGYYAAGKTSRPLMLAFISVIVSVVSATLLLNTFTKIPAFRYFIESLLRVDTVSGTSMLMLALGFSLGCLVAACLGLWFFAKDFTVSLQVLAGTFMRSFAASTIGGFGSYLSLTAMGRIVNINTFSGIFAQGLVAGLAGLAVTAIILYVLKSPELREVVDALKRRLSERADVALEPSDLSSNPTT
jgi:putative peptidoglycan lipid II flippase